MKYYPQNGLFILDKDIQIIASDYDKVSWSALTSNTLFVTYNTAKLSLYSHFSAEANQREIIVD